MAKAIGQSVGNDDTTALQVVAPFFRYVFLFALWSVAFTTSMWLTLLFYVIFIAVALLARVNPFRAWLVVVFVLIVVAGSAIQRLSSGSAVSIDLLRVALKMHLLFGSAAVVFAGTTAIQHFYAWSSLVGGTVAGAIIGMGRGITYFPHVVLQTRDSFKLRGRRIVGNLLDFAMSLFGSVLHFTRTYSDALEMRGLSRMRGEGDLREPASVAELLLLCVSILLVVSVYLEQQLPSKSIPGPTVRQQSIFIQR